MNTADSQHAMIERRLPRAQTLAIIQAALQVGQVRFAREAVLEWLGQIPGDLQASLVYAQALLAEQENAQARKAALAVLRGLCLADPEYLEAADTWLRAESGQSGSPAPVDPLQGALLRANLYALTGKTTTKETLAGWGSAVWMARQALFAGELNQSKEWLRQALSEQLPTPLAHVTHLRLLQVDPAVPLAIRRKTAERYSRLWPDNLACMLFLADWSMEGGDSGAAVAMLHQAAARDAGGQVAQRLWGEQHPYRRIWPEGVQLTLSQAIPAQVAAALGWNRLPEGSPRAAPKVLGKLPEELRAGAGTSLDGRPAGSPSAEPQRQVQPSPAPAEPRRRLKLQPKILDGDLRAVQRELDRLALKAKVPGASSVDGRYPIYVLFSVRSRMQAVYGQKALELIETEMQRLVEVLQRRRGWGARLFWADAPQNQEKLGIQTGRTTSAWELKLALADLDEALAKRGEMIGAVLIVGGPEIVPFHCLPNPVDDQDDEVASDNPYATRDENYFVPEWPLGRLPGGAGKDARLLLGSLRRIRESHARQITGTDGMARWLQAAVQALGLGSNSRSSLGYTAAIWKRAAEAVFRPIGGRRYLHASPPMGAPVTPMEGDANGKARLPRLQGRLAYFNLHGVVDAAEWFGHRDPFDEDADGPDYPVALRPGDLANYAGHAPEVVFSEACYGLHLQGRSVEQALPLTFLEAGSLAVVGSTCMAYGSVDEPLAAADWLGHAFWRHLQAGYPAGEALRQAKLGLADEMTRRQGYLDGEDQKTLISFCLVGDPLAAPAARKMGSYGAKSVRRAAVQGAALATICDRRGRRDETLPPEALQRVRQVVAKYLPGMLEGRLEVSYEHEACQGEGHVCPTSQLRSAPSASLGSKSNPQAARHAGRKLVTISKQASRSGGAFTQVARLTLDETGEVVKLVVSR